jgi:four helix bundle protein
MKYQHFEDLPVWQCAVDLTVSVFTLTAARPFQFQGDLANQLQRAALSISNNIAEGYERGTTQELITFLYYARGSAGEVRSILSVALRMKSLMDFKLQISNLKAEAESISRQLAAWLKTLKETDIRGERYLTEKDRKRKERQRESREFLEQLRKEIEERGNASQEACEEPWQNNESDK